jgi:hypothetical protein
MKLLTGFLLGIIFKDRFLNGLVTCASKFYFPEKKKKELQKIYSIRLRIIITNKEYFSFLFPKAKNTEYHEIIFNDQIVNFINNKLTNLDITLKTICDLNLDEYPLKQLSKIGMIYMYIDYLDNSQDLDNNQRHYTNVYGILDSIKESDFQYSNKSFYLKYHDTICATLVPTKYVTSQFKRYFNQPDNSLQITPEILFGCKSKLILLSRKETKTFENDEVI